MPMRYIFKIQPMQFLNPEIAALTKNKKTPSLVKQEYSCSIFQDVKKWVDDSPANSFKE